MAYTNKALKEIILPKSTIFPIKEKEIEIYAIKVLVFKPHQIIIQNFSMRERERAVILKTKVFESLIWARSSLCFSSEAQIKLWSGFQSYLMQLGQPWAPGPGLHQANTSEQAWARDQINLTQIAMPESNPKFKMTSPIYTCNSSLPKSI